MYFQSCSTVVLQGVPFREKKIKISSRDLETTMLNFSKIKCWHAVKISHFYTIKFKDLNNSYIKCTDNIFMHKLSTNLGTKETPTGSHYEIFMERNLLHVLVNRWRVIYFWKKLREKKFKLLPSYYCLNSLYFNFW